MGAACQDCKFLLSVALDEHRYEVADPGIVESTARRGDSLGNGRFRHVRKDFAQPVDHLPDQSIFFGALHADMMRYRTAYSNRFGRISNFDGELFWPAARIARPFLPPCEAWLVG